MPLVLAMNEASESGISYEDVPYVAYEYPTIYRRRIREGVPFVYYRGRKKAGGGRQIPSYIGTGILGPIRESANGKRLVCEILDGKPFASPLPFKTADGTYLEPGGATSGYYVQGVREISNEVFANILASADALQQTTAGSNTGGSPPSPSSTKNSLYADSAVGREVEEYSRKAVVAYLQDTYPQARICEMPLNNPGYDLGVDGPELRFVEVKGTQANFPRFLMSEGERRFGEQNREAYLLAVVYGIDLSRGVHLGIETASAPLGSAQRLEPVQWGGRLGDG